MDWSIMHNNYLYWVNNKEGEKHESMRMRRNKSRGEQKIL
jgi:hypothetical protein